TMRAPGAFRVGVTIAVLAWSTRGVSALAAEQTVRGRKLAIVSPGGSAPRKVTCTGHETGSPNTLVGDPTVDGGSLDVIANGGTSSSQSFPLPQGTSTSGKRFWTGTAATGFKYLDAKGQNGPVRLVRLSRSASGTFLVKAKLSGTSASVSVVPPNPGMD